MVYRELADHYVRTYFMTMEFIMENMTVKTLIYIEFWQLICRTKQAL